LADPGSVRVGRVPLPGDDRKSAAWGHAAYRTESKPVAPAIRIDASGVKQNHYHGLLDTEP